jgi:predicted glutamine amidotransferase
MLIFYSLKPSTIPINLLKKFIKSCHWGYLNKYDLIGHHNAGWGYSYLPQNHFQNLVIKRTLTPIYHSQWKDLVKLKTRFFIIHARKTLFGEKKLENVHPINIGGKYCMTHNGTIKIDSFPVLKNPSLQHTQENTDLDTRKYLCTILDHLNQEKTLKNAIERTINKIQVSSAANAFLFNENECHIIKYQKDTYNGRHITLFIEKTPKQILISTTPLSSTALEIPNHVLLSIPKIQSKKLTIDLHKLTLNN